MQSNHKKKGVITFEKEIILLSLLFLNLSIIAILNLGFIGNIIFYSLSYVFGIFNLFLLAFIIYNTFFVFFIRKRAPFFKSFKVIIFYFFILSLMILVSFTTVTHDNFLTYYNDLFSSLITINYKISIDQIFSLNGGIIGLYLYNILALNIGVLTTKIMISILSFLSFFVLFKSVFINFVKDIKKNHLVKKAKKAEKSVKKEEVVEIKKENEEIKRNQKLTFDIFREPIFEDKKVVITDNNIDNIENVDVVVKIEEVEEINQITVNDVVYDDNENPYNLLISNVLNDYYEDMKDYADENVFKIEKKLEEFNIKAKVNNYIIGPCVTRYEIVPDVGVRVSSLVNIENDLKLALAAVSMRMEAPIPGKSAVGIEVANKKKNIVYLKEILTPYIENKDRLLVGVGKDLENEGVIINLDKMPHLLIAGATGSGKSVCINSIIVSILLRTSPEDVKLLLIDPKRVELSAYSNIPHLIAPVICDPKLASLALKKVIEEMEERYDLFVNNSVKNIDGYNRLMKDLNKPLMPSIVIIIDELADLMMVASKDVEDSIQRITQLARASGIHLVVATQRPSVDVITGIIKANIPSRIAFAVSSGVDSRIIIDQIGAEKLLGKGDMLMNVTGSIGLNRVQGALVSDEEVERVVRYVKGKYQVEYNSKFLNLKEENESNNILDNSFNDDELYEQVKEFIITSQKASTSLIQRYYALGYSRAAKIMDRLEKEGVIGPQVDFKSREVLIKKDEENGNY